MKRVKNLIKNKKKKWWKQIAIVIAYTMGNDNEKVLAIKERIICKRKYYYSKR